MGTPDFAAAALSRIAESGYEVVGAVTQPDKPKGRGMTHAASAGQGGCAGARSTGPSA